MAGHELALPRQLHAVQQGSDLLPYEWLATIVRRPEPPWLVRRFLPANALTMMFGDSGTGKSFLAAHIAVAVATGGIVFGEQCARAGVAYIACEGANGMRARLEAIKAHHSDLPGDTPLMLIGEELRLFDRQQHVDSLHATLEDFDAKLAAQGDQLGLIILDTLAQAFVGADENTGVDASLMTSICAGLRARFKCAVLVVHHSGKNAALGPRGHSSMRAAYDGVLEVKCSGKSRSVTVTKMRDGEEGHRILFQLKPVALAVDADGKLVSSCVVEEVGDVESNPLGADADSGAAKALRHAVTQTLRDRGELAENRFGLRAEHRIVRRAAVQKAFLESQYAKGRTASAARQAFGRAVNDAVEAGWLGKFNENTRKGWVWLVSDVDQPPPSRHCDDS